MSIQDRIQNLITIFLLFSLAFISISCSTSQTASQTDNSESILLPTPTYAPTLSPGVLTEFVYDLTSNIGLHETNILGVNVKDWLDLGISIGLALIIGIFISRMVVWLLNRLASRTDMAYDDTFVKLITPQIHWIIVFIGIHFGTLRLSFFDAAIKGWLIRFYTAIYVLAITIIVWRLIDIALLWYQNEVEPRRDQKQVDTLLILLHRGARIILVTISLTMLLSLYGINVNALIAALGIGGLAISLAAQDTLSNIISGIMIMLDQPFRVGDRIEIQGLGTWGDVVDIGLRTTRVRTRDNRLVIVPNNRISTDQVINYTFPDPQYRVQFEIGVGYGQDVEKVRTTIVDTVRAVEGVLQDKPVDALYVKMGESAMIFRIRWWIESYEDTRRMFDRVNTALQNKLDQAGIELPFNTYNINIQKTSSQDLQSPNDPN